MITMEKGVVDPRQLIAAEPIFIPPPPGKKRVRVLLAEDNKVNQLIAVKMLEKYGYHVDVVANGNECLAALNLVPYDLILMDCHMPEMDGYEATRVIRQSHGKSFQHIPIIAITANAMNGDREECLRAGMTDYIAKPIKVQEILTILEKVLSKISAA